MFILTVNLYISPLWHIKNARKFVYKPTWHVTWLDMTQKLTKVDLESVSYLSHFFRFHYQVSRCLLKQRMMEMVVTTGTISHAKLQSNHHHQQTNTQLLYRPDALIVAQPTVSKHWMENITLHNWSYKSWKAPSPPTNQHPVTLQAGCPSCRPTNSVKALKGKYHIPWTCLPQAHLGVFQLCYLTTNSSWLPRGRVAVPLISPLMPVPQVISADYVVLMKQCDVSRV